MIPDAVRERFPWPELPPGLQPFVVNMDGGGRYLIDRLNEKHRVHTMLEIGCFLGGSALRWLSSSPRLELVAVDPWPMRAAGDWVSSEEDWFSWPKPDAGIVAQLNAVDGLYHTFLTNLSLYRSRLVPVPASSQSVLEELHALGLRPDLIYIDAHKNRDDLEMCRRLWPDAYLTGDDYSRTGRSSCR